MEYYNLLKKREAAGKPIKVGVVGAGVYGSMFLSQLNFIPGMKLVGVADLDIAKAKKVCISAGWPEEAISIGNTTSAINQGSERNKIVLTEDASKLIQANVDIILEVTGITEAGAYHAWSALEAGKHVVMVTVEADALLGIALRQLADKNGLIYSMGYGDEPALLCEQVDWARTAGFEAVCVGKTRPYPRPESQHSTPETGWKFFGLSEEQVATGKFNLKMYNSFADGTKTLIELCAVGNACNLVPQASGFKYPVMEYEELPGMLKPKSEGGVLDHSGTIEILPNAREDGTPLKRTLMYGVYTVFKGRSEYVKSHLDYFSKEGRILTDKSGQYSIMYRPTHIIGLELGISVASVGLLGLPTGSPNSFVADVVAVAKKDLKPGDILDGEGGYAAYGKLVPAELSLRNSYLPIGLSDKTKMAKHVAKDSTITYNDVLMDESRFIYKLRRAVEKQNHTTNKNTV